MKGTTSYFSCASPSSLATCSSIHRTAILRDTTHGPRTPRRNPITDCRRKSSASSADSTDPCRALLSSSRFGAGGGGASSFFDIIPGDDVGRQAVRRLLALEAPKSQCRTKAEQRSRRDMIESAVLMHSYSTGSRLDQLQILTKSQHTRRDIEAAAVLNMSSSSSSSSSAKPQDQVVALRVSLHCKGCEGKVRRHIAKMQGVRSFEVDLARKKVTVAGDVTPLGVLSSISKVKHAQFWQSPPRASASF